MSDARGWKTTGWQGISLSTPDAWNLVAYGGDEKSGNLRLDNGEATPSSVLGVELRWSTLKNTLKDADLDQRLDQFFANIRKSSKREKLSVDTKSKAVKDDRFPDRAATRTFQWKADRKGYGRIWYCETCKRLVIAQMVSGLKGDNSAVAHDLLASIRCHSDDDAWRLWSLYDLTSQIPSGYRLKGQPQLLNIYVSLSFERAPHETIVLEQWGVANVQLRDRYLDEWFRHKNGELVHSLKYETEETDVNGHPALLITGRQTGLMYWFGKVIPQLLRLQRPAPHYGACLWECPETNKIEQVQVFARKPCREVLKSMVERTPCHS